MTSVVLVVALLAVAACKPLSYPIAATDPSDPSVPVPPARYQSATAGYLSQRPVAPGGWREQNERVTPQPQR